MIPRMTALIALLALLLSGPACRAESLGDVPQVVDAGADKQVIALPSQPPDPPLAPDKNGREAAAEVENQRRFNELRREFLDDRREFLDARAKNVDWWLTAIGVVAPLVAFIIGLLGFQRLREIEADARRDAAASKKSAEEAERLVEKIRANSDEAEKLLEKLDAQSIGKNVDEATRTAESVQRDPAASVIGRARAAAVLLQYQGKIEEAIEKWRAIANVAGEADRQLQARAWFSVGYLLDKEEGADLGAVIDAYTKAINLDQDYAGAYLNRGLALSQLDRHLDAIADFDWIIKLNSADAEAHVNRGFALSRLDRHLDAIADFDRAIKLNSADALAHYGRGAANLSLSRISEARADLQQALVLAQESGIANLVTIVERDLGRLDNKEEP